MAVTKTTGTYKSTCKAYDIDIFYAVWKDDSKNPIGVIQLTHGWAEYIERYDEMARYLANEGYIVCGQDHLGHGKTCGLANRGVYPPKAGKWMVEDMNTLRKLMQKQYPKLPYMLYGHSLGSLMTRTYISKYGKGLAACVICGTVPIPSYAFLLQLAGQIVHTLMTFHFQRVHTTNTVIGVLTRTLRHGTILNLIHKLGVVDQRTCHLESNKACLQHLIHLIF